MSWTYWEIVISSMRVRRAVDWGGAGNQSDSWSIRTYWSYVMIVLVVMTMIFFIVMNVFQSDFPPDSPSSPDA